MTNALQRLQKVIAQSGITSRRKAEKLIIDGQVKVNDETVTKLGTKVSKNDEIEVNGIPLEKEEPVYLLLYKPREVISSVSDDKNRQVVTDLIHGVKERIFPVGRLDYQTTGILLLTNDGEFANQLMHPKYGIDKVYVAKIKGIPSKDTLKKLIKGVQADDDILRVVHYSVLSVDRQKNMMIIKMTLHEGRNRHIRRMMEQIGHPVTKLVRESYGSLTLNGLQPGEYRALKPHEVKQLRLLSSGIVEK